jgi:type IV pilus assembly protein PilE
VELTVSLAIVALLSAIGVSSYRNSVLRARRADARDALLQLQVLQERYYFEHGRYSGALAALAQPPPVRSNAGHYVLSIAASDDGEGFIARAVPVADGAQQDDRDCREFTLDATGRRTASGAVDADQRCWFG